MLKPAILYKDEIIKCFYEKAYSTEMYYYTGYAYDSMPPDIELKENWFQFASINDCNELMGFISYYIDPIVDTVEKFGLISFTKTPNLTIAKDLFNLLNELCNNHHRLEWKMVGGNPVERNYDKFCADHNGNKVVLHDVTKGVDGKYRDLVIYEIINGKLK